MTNMNKSVYSFVPRASSAFRLSSSLRSVHYRTKCFLLYRKFFEFPIQQKTTVRTGGLKRGRVYEKVYSSPTSS